MIKLKSNFWIGSGILIFLVLSYFVPVNSVEQEGILNIETRTPLLGIIIFYNPFVLGLYILVSIVLIARGIARKSSR